MSTSVFQNPITNIHAKPERFKCNQTRYRRQFRHRRWRHQIITARTFKTHSRMPITRSCVCMCMCSLNATDFPPYIFTHNYLINGYKKERTLMLFILLFSEFYNCIFMRCIMSFICLSACTRGPCMFHHHMSGQASGS